MTGYWLTLYSREGHEIRPIEDWPKEDLVNCLTGLSTYRLQDEAEHEAEIGLFRLGESYDRWMDPGAAALIVTPDHRTQDDDA